MEKFMPSFEYEPLLLSLEPKTSNEEEDRGDIDGVGPLDKSSRGGKDNPEKEATKQTSK
jgi:hypothetical protein